MPYVTTAEIETFLRAFWRSDWGTCSSLLADDAVYEDPLLERPVRGREAILATLEFCHSWAELEPRLVSLFGDGELFCAELRIAGKVTKAVEGIPARSVGRSFDFAEVDVFQSAGGAIRRMSIYADVVGMQRQIDA